MRIVVTRYVSLCVLFLVSSCGSAPAFDYNTATDFTKVKTYGFYTDLQSGLSEFDEQRIKQALDSLLPTKNMRSSVNPDMLINFYASEQLAQGSTIGVGVGGGGMNGSVGVSGGIPVGGNKIEQLLTLDFISNAQDALIWQGTLVSTYSAKANAGQMKAHYLKAISKLLKGYPPKK